MVYAQQFLNAVGSKLEYMINHLSHETWIGIVAVLVVAGYMLMRKGPG